jgi:hypothetical protein
MIIFFLPIYESLPQSKQFQNEEWVLDRYQLSSHCLLHYILVSHEPLIDDRKN